MASILSAILIVGGTGIFLGAVLAFASFIFKVEEDERIELINSELPGANCGGCGYAGCSAYATAIVLENAPINACSVGKNILSQKIAAIMGCETVESEPMTAHILCSGSCDVSKEKFEYSGIPDCIAASKLSGGQKKCPDACLGFGTCKNVCQFDAIIIENGIAKIDDEKCVACGKCVEICPKHIIDIIPKKQKYIVDCSSNTNGAATGKNCTVGCIGCKICEKNCPHGAIKVEDNLAKIDYSLCQDCGICMEKCPKKIIHLRG